MTIDVKVPLNIDEVHHIFLAYAEQEINKIKRTYELWSDLWKPDIIKHFFQILLHFYYLHTQLCVLAKFQLHILKAFKVTVLQSSSNRKIDLYSKYRKNKLLVLTKTDVTYEWSGVRTWNLHHCVSNDLRNGLLGKLFLLLPFITANKVEIHEEHQSQTITSTSRELVAITYNSFGPLQSNKDFQAPLAWAN